MFADVWRDIRYAARSLSRSPSFTFIVTATLALGIGANSVIFSAIDAVLLRDAPVSSPETLVDVYTTSGSNAYSNSSYPDYFDLRDSHVFAALAAFAPIAMTVDVNGAPEPVRGQIVSGNYFDVLGIRLPLGRGFTADEDRVGAPVRVAVISHTLWRRVFNSDTTLVGRPIRLNAASYTLVGIAPPGFSGSLAGDAPDVWVPSPLQPEVDPVAASVRRQRGHAGKLDLRGSRGLRIVGRLAPGTDIERTSIRADAVARQLEAAYPDTNRNRRFSVAPLGEGRGLRVSTRPVLTQLAAAVLLVLVVACVNVAGLLVIRAASREREVAVRLAIGASRSQLVRQWLVESVLLGCLAAAGALAVTAIGTPLLHAFVIPEAVDLSLNLRVLVFTLGAGVSCGLFFGLAPAMHTLRRGSSGTLRDRGSIGIGGTALRVRNAFAVTQIAVSLVLVVGAGLFLRTLEKAYSVDLGYEIDDVLVATINLQTVGYTEETGPRVYEELLSAVNRVPGVVTAGAARMIVLNGGARSTTVSMDGQPIAPGGGNGLGVRANVVSDRYFELMRIPILRGRSFDASDSRGGQRAAIVTTSLANRLWPNADPVGKRLRDESRDALVVVGVVPDTVYTTTVEEQRPPAYYLRLGQNYESDVALHVRAAGTPTALLPALRDAVRRVDARLVLERPERMQDVMNRTLGRQRMMATLVGLFGALTLVLAVFGLYGVMAHTAAERTPEVGIRLAMGAQRSSILALFVRQGLVLVAMGASIGCAGALLAGRYIESQLFGITARDPLAFLAGVATLSAACLAATAIPAMRAMRVDPITALRRN